MRQWVTLDVVDRPRGGTVATALRLRRAPLPEGCLGLIPCATQDFTTRYLPKPTPRRMAVVAAWAHPEAADCGTLAGLRSGARERWHVRGELARATGTDPWGTWVPDAADAEPLAGDEPVLVLISGELGARHLLPFARDVPRTVAHAERQPGYLGGLAVNSSPLNTTSCSAWRSASDSRRYAFAAGAHKQAMDADVAAERHRTSRFLRVRPVATSGTLRGRDPFAGLVGRAAALT